MSSIFLNFRLEDMVLEEKLVEIAFMFLCLTEDARKEVLAKCSKIPEIKNFLDGIADKIKAVK